MIRYLLIGAAIYLALIVIKWLLGVAYAILSSAPMVLLGIACGVFIIVGFAYNASVPILTGGERLPWMGFDKRTVPFQTISQIGTTTVSREEFGRDDVRLSFVLHNNSVYPVREVRIRCRYDLPNTNSHGSDDFYIMTQKGESLMPGRSRTFVAGSYEGTNIRLDPIANPSCRVLEASTGWTVWTGIPFRYQHLDWQRGYRGRSFTK